MDTKQTVKWLTEKFNPATDNLTQYLEQEAKRIEADRKEEVDGNVTYFKQEQVVLRIKKIKGVIRYVDTLLPEHRRPHKRAFIADEKHVKFIRYYELDTWQRNYDVHITNDFELIFTRHYLATGEQFAWLYQGAHDLYTEDNLPTLIERVK
jgi:hypothetical protein